MGRDHRLLRRGHRRLTPVFADVDTGIDDALALVFLLASSDADLIGLAATAGLSLPLTRAVGELWETSAATLPDDADFNRMTRFVPANDHG